MSSPFSFRSLGFLLFGIGLLFSCMTNEADDRPQKNGSITLSLQTLSLTHPTSALLEEDKHQLLLTVRAGDGKLTDHLFNRTEIRTNNQTLSVRLELPAGDYELSSVHLRDSTESVTFAAPNAGSPLSEQTPISLPVSFTVAADSNKDIALQGLSTRSFAPEDFGFAPAIAFKVCDGGEYKGNVILQSQADVDEFGLNCYSSINGNLDIAENQTEDPIVDLTGLASIKSISRSLGIARNSSLKSLEGLQHISSAISVSISHNQVLESLDGLDGLNRVSATFMLNSNPALSSLSGLGGLVSLNLLSILANNQLRDLSGLDNLEKVGDLHITSNARFSSVSGAPKLTQIGTLHLETNPLTSLSGFNSTIVSLRNLWISHASVSDFTGMLAPEGKVGSLTLVMNSGVYDLEGLSFESTAGSIDIRNNSVLSDITELGDIKKVNGRLRISGNRRLANLCALTPIFTENPDMDATIDSNGYNPTAEDIRNGACAK